MEQEFEDVVSGMGQAIREVIDLYAESHDMPVIAILGLLEIIKAELIEEALRHDE